MCVVISFGMNSSTGNGSSMNDLLSKEMDGAICATECALSG